MQLSKDSGQKFDFMSGSVKNIQESLATAHRKAQEGIMERREKELIQYQNEISLLKKEFGNLQSTLSNACKKIKVYENIFENIDRGKNVEMVVLGPENGVLKDFVGDGYDTKHLF